MQKVGAGMSSPLFTEVALGEMVLANRIAVSPMAQYSGVTGSPQPWHVQHLGSMAASGPGLVVIESTSVEATGYGSTGCLALHNDEQEAAFRTLAASIRAVSAAKLGVQFGHSGRKASLALPQDGGAPMTPDNGGWSMAAPSAIAFAPGWPVPEALDEAGLTRVRGAYRQAAARAARLDLDLIEVHAAHGYLLHSFLSPISNRREDAYGGTPENRLRFVREVMADIRAAFPRPRALGIRLNCHDWLEGGLTIEDTVTIAAALREVGCDYVDVSAGAISGEARIPAKPGYLAPFSERIRREAGIATMVTGMIFDPALANDIIAGGQADAVAIGRAFLDDPRWVWRAAEQLGVGFDYPMQYERSAPSRWSGAKSLRPSPLRAA
jgi:NADPH2 dehydrogenase